MRPYRYSVQFERFSFWLVINAASDDAAALMAGEIGQRLGIMLIGPV